LLCDTAHFGSFFQNEAEQNLSTFRKNNKTAKSKFRRETSRDI